jgi:hypothetical protein
MTDVLTKVKARKKVLENSQRGQRTNYSIRPALEDEEKYRRPPNLNFNPSGDAGSRKHLHRIARAKRIKQKNPRDKDHKPVEPKIVETPPEHYRYKGTSRQDAEDMREHIEQWDEVAAWVVECDGVYYTVYAD